MTTEKNELRSNTNLHNFAATAKAGFGKAIHSPCKGALTAVLLALLAVMTVRLFFPVTIPSVLYGITGATALVFYVFFAALIFAGMGYENGAISMLHDFSRVGFVNTAGEPPYLIHREKDDKGITTLTFWGKRLPVSEWTDNQTKIETALNMYVATVSERADRRTVVLQCVSPEFAFKIIEWKDSYTYLRNDSILVLGMGLLGPVTVDIDNMAHILVGGGTGSGKTMLLKVLLWQAVLQADVVYIADFKGGGDYPIRWHKFSHIIYQEEVLLERLNHIKEEIEYRKTAFRDEGVSNIKEYRAKTGNYMQRIIFACDEVSQLLDTTGASKERKEHLAKVEALLSLIARQRRALGIHLFFATQRPDANVVPGQIKNNMDIRICGRADATLSTIVLGDGRADEQIPKDARGRFIMQDGTLFQGFYFDDRDEQEKVG